MQNLTQKLLQELLMLTKSKIGSRSHGSTGRDNLPLVLTLLFISLISVNQVSAQQVDQRVAGKPSVASRDSSGATYIALDSKLRQVFKGSEPRSLDELRALESQQSKVAEAIEKVTVNVQQGSAQGSGVIITGDGYVLTAAHVAGKPGRDAWVVLNDGTRLPAKTLGMNRNKDAGLLKITASRSAPWPHATLGHSQDLEIGQWCIAAGHPGGWHAERGNVIRVGRILAIKGERKSPHTLFTDCTLIGGDSGGPLFTLEGKLIGIHSRIGTDMQDNMHVPIDVFATDWTRLKNGEAWGVLPGYRPIIGVSGPPDSDSAVVERVEPGSPAQRAGVAAGDLILSFDGNKISSFKELQLAVQQTLPGDTVMIEVSREGQTYRLPLTVGVEQ
jgi:serine protease Do